MAKLRDLITEREFGEPLPTFKDVMEKHQINKLKEDWWDDLGPEGQAKYLKDNPGSQKAQDAKKDDSDMGDTAADPFSRDYDADKHGESPHDKYDDNWGDEFDEPSGGQPSVDDSRRKAVQSGMALKKAEGEFGMDSPEYEAAKGADDEAQGEYQQAKASQEQRQKDINSGKAEPENKEEADLAAADARDSVEKQKQNRAYALQQPDPRDPRSPAEQEAGWDKTVADAEERAGEAEAKAKEFGSSRTGTELNQETLTIDGKQFRRISEGVEKQPKPKYEFSEFYQRFKR